jgi:hypothetical protein
MGISYFPTKTRNVMPQSMSTNLCKSQFIRHLASSSCGECFYFGLGAQSQAVIAHPMSAKAMQHIECGWE